MEMKQPEPYGHYQIGPRTALEKTETDRFTGRSPVRHPEEPSQLDLPSIGIEGFESLETNTAPLPLGFRRTRDGLYIDVSGRDPAKKWECLSAPLGISAMVRDENDRHGCEVAYFDRDGQYTTTIVWLNSTKSPAKIRRQLEENGLRLANNSGCKPDPLCHFIKQSVAAKTKQVLTRHGWSKDKDAFLLGSSVLGSDEYLSDVRSSKSDFEQVGSITDWHEANGQVLEKCPIAVFIVCYALAGPLWELLGLKAPAVHLYGQNPALKRFLVDLANSIFGDPHKLYLIWNMSRTAAEAFRIEHNHGFVAFDDLTGTQIPGAWSIVHQLANGIPRARTVCNGQVRREENWNLSTLSTGCSPIEKEWLGIRLAQQPSLHGQIVSVPLFIGLDADDPGQVSEIPLERLNSEKTDSASSWPGSGTVGWTCINKLIQDQPRILNAIAEEREKVLQSTDCDGVVHQDHTAAALLFSVAEAVGRVFAAQGCLPIDPDAVTRSVRVVERTWRSNVHKAGIARHKGLLSKLSRVIRDTDNDRSGLDYEFNPIVIIDKDGTFIGSSDFEKLCRIDLSSAADDKPEDSKRFQFELTQIGVIVRKNGDELTWRKRHNGQQVRVIKIDRDRLEELVSSRDSSRKSPKKNLQESRRESQQERFQKIRERIAQRPREVSHND